MNDIRDEPLAGMTVLDLGQIYNGPYCGVLMAFAGARVIKVEPPTGDIVRQRMRGGADPYPYLLLNSNKESVVLDLKQPRGRDLFLHLVERADAVIENFNEGVMERLGLGWDVLQQRNTRLVYGRGRGYGPREQGPVLPAMDLTIQAVTGVMSATGYPDRPPVKAGPAVSDFLGGVHLYAAVVTALLARERTGRGQHVDVAMQEAVIWSLASAIGAHFDDGPTANPPRTGNRHPALALAPYNVYEAADGFVAIICVAERHWRSLARVIGRPDLIHDARFAGTVPRAKNMDAIDGIVGAWVAGRSRESAIALLVDAGVPCAPVNSVADVVDDPDLRRNGFLVDAERRDGSPIRLATSPLRFEQVAGRSLLRMAPRLGEHTDAVLQELLGLADGELAELRSAGVTAIAVEGDGVTT